MYCNVTFIYFQLLTVSYAFLGAEEGLYSLELSKNTDPIMEQVTMTTTLYYVESIWLGLPESLSLDIHLQ